MITDVEQWKMNGVWATPWVRCLYIEDVHSDPSCLGPVTMYVYAGTDRECPLPFCDEHVVYFERHHKFRFNQ